MLKNKQKYILSNEELLIEVPFDKWPKKEWDTWLEMLSKETFHKISLPLCANNEVTESFANIIAVKNITQLSLVSIKNGQSLGQACQQRQMGQLPSEIQFFVMLLNKTKDTLISLKLSDQDFQKLTPTAFTALKIAFLSLTEIQFLKISACHVGRMSPSLINIFLSILSEMKTLNGLKIASNELYLWEKSNLTALIMGIQDLPLQYLDLKNNYLCEKNIFGYEFFQLLTKSLSRLDCVNFSENGLEEGCEQTMGFDSAEDNLSSESNKQLTLQGLNQLPLGCLFITKHPSFVKNLNIANASFFWAKRLTKPSQPGTSSSFALYSTKALNLKPARHMLWIALILYLLYLQGYQSQYDAHDLQTNLFAANKQSLNASSSPIWSLTRPILSFSYQKIEREYISSFAFEIIMQIIDYLATKEQATGIFCFLDRIHISQTGLSFFANIYTDPCFQRASSEYVPKK